MRSHISIGLAALTLSVLCSSNVLADIGGVWTTPPGAFGRMVLRQFSDGTFHGTYTPRNDSGTVKGTIAGTRAVGYWAETYSNQRCLTPLLGRYYWGRVVMNFDAGFRTLTGTWGYCNAVPSRPFQGARVGRVARTPIKGFDIAVSLDSSKENYVWINRNSYRPGVQASVWVKVNGNRRVACATVRSLVAAVLISTNSERRVTPGDVRLVRNGQRVILVKSGFCPYPVPVPYLIQGRSGMKSPSPLLRPNQTIFAKIVVYVPKWKEDRRNNVVIVGPLRCPPGQHVRCQ